MPFPSNSTNSFPQYIKNEDPRFTAIHRSKLVDHQQQQRRLPHSISRSRSTDSSSLVYSSTNVSTRRLSSGSACEVCRKRKTKCDGGNPCAFCAANGVECVHRATRRKKSSLMIESSNATSANNNNKSSPSINNADTTTVTTILFNGDNSNDINENTINGGTVGTATPSRITLNNTSSGNGGNIDATNNNSNNNNIVSDVPSWVKNLGIFLPNKIYGLCANNNNNNIKQHDLMMFGFFIFQP